MFGEQEVLRLSKDISEHPDKTDYYLGSLILHRHGEKLNIIDGQQRITSLLILQQFQHDRLDADIEYESPVSIAAIGKNIEGLEKRSQLVKPGLSRLIWGGSMSPWWLPIAKIWPILFLRPRIPAANACRDRTLSNRTI
ncbi:DUF262 domain-containing protein [Pedobacter psychrotolerans]|uniref:DUF262 domain-containing protein n=1 Tax=Pedobacter psychrotolerans TaxID=1843235 RepID=UPI003F99629B